MGGAPNLPETGREHLGENLGGKQSEEIRHRINGTTHSYGTRLLIQFFTQISTEVFTPGFRQVGSKVGEWLGVSGVPA